MESPCKGQIKFKRLKERKSLQTSGLGLCTSTEGLKANSVEESDQGAAGPKLLINKCFGL